MTVGSGLVYTCTNESLDAIIKGLNPQPRDDILAICGSGDQVFALLEKAGKISVVDYLPHQLSYFEKRKGWLKAGEYERFLNPGKDLAFRESAMDLINRRRYFSEDRMKLIRGNLETDVTEQVSGDIFSLDFHEGTFNKIYLSNVLSYTWNTPDEIRAKLKLVARSVKDNGLVYLSEYPKLIRHYGPKGDEGKSFLSPMGLKVHEEMTAMARELQSHTSKDLTWVPAVLQKVA